MKNNQLIVEDRKTGKTTYLLNEIDRIVNEGFNVVVLDSATEHENKSLLRKVQKKYKNAYIVNMTDEEKIVLGKVTFKEYIENFKNYFPYDTISKNKGKIICFDLSYFLEKGHDVYDETNNVNIYHYYRNLYNQLSQQIILTLILMDHFDIIKESFIVMDEIEVPRVDYDISCLQQNSKFIASVHPENAFGTFYQSFDKIKFSCYQKRKV